MTKPTSIRFDEVLLARLRRRAQAAPGASTSALAQRLVDEGLRMADHPGILFKDGPTGRRAALAYGPDVWEIIKVLREVDERGPTAIAAAADILALDVSRITLVVAYYSDYRDEVDAEIAAADEASERAERAWRVQQRLIA
jgi:ABC-type ATPase involved in cell division